MLQTLFCMHMTITKLSSPSGEVASMVVEEVEVGVGVEVEEIEDMEVDEDEGEGDELGEEEE